MTFEGCKGRDWQVNAPAEVDATSCGAVGEDAARGHCIAAPHDVHSPACGYPQSQTGAGAVLGREKSSEPVRP